MAKKATTLTVSQARQSLYRLVDDAAASHQPVLITSKRANAVLVSEDDWRALQETIYLLSIKGMRESIRAGMATPIKDCASEPGW
jgi:prevent-host-death family protein